MKPLVSVLIITYNQIGFIKETLESVLGQDYKNLQIVVADDASEDGTTEIILDYAARFPKIVVPLVGGDNLGITGNSNRGLRECTGQYVAFLGGDDMMLPQKISRQVSLMESDPTCSICYHDLDVFESKTGNTIYRFNKINRPYSGDVRGIVKFGTVNGGSSTMVRLSAIPVTGFDETLPVASDWLFWIETLISSQGKIRYIDEILGRYRRHDGNVTSIHSSALTQALIDHVATCSKVIVKYPKLGSLARHRLGTILRGMRHREEDYSLYLRSSFQCSFQLKTLALLLLYYCTFGIRRY